MTALRKRTTGTLSVPSCSTVSKFKDTVQFGLSSISYTFFGVDRRGIGGRSANQGETEEEEYRVDRVQRFFSCRPNWESHTPSHAGECVTPPLVWGGGYTLACGRGGGGGPNADD